LTLKSVLVIYDNLFNTGKTNKTEVCKLTCSSFLGHGKGTEYSEYV